MRNINPVATTSGGPFDLDTKQAYLRWRQAKLRSFPETLDSIKVAISNPRELTPTERASLVRHCRSVSMAIYSIDSSTCSKADLVKFGQQLGLNRLDGNLCADEDKITSLQVVETGRHTTYIPYTNKRLSWHTDGYYNPPERQIRGMLLHCVENAAEGGENQLLDHEWAYIHLRDENPAYISALMHPRAMTIPPNTAEGDELRGEQSGPVFSIMADNQSLHMRYSARTRNIVWREDSLTQEAQACLSEFLASDSPYIFQYRLQPGEGVVTNNVLHNRTSFKDEVEDKHRLLYRARYYDRVAETELATFFSV